jgi:uncharacterized phage protein (TIGR02218 family)
MPVELVNGHVLIPDPANWRDPVQWSRRFHTAITEALTGLEDRANYRARPLQQLSWTATPHDANQEARLADRVRAALKSGKAAAPYHGRSAVLELAASAGATVVQIEATAWTPAAGDRLFFADPQNPLTWEVRDVQSWDSGARQITLTAALTYAWPAGGLLWPLIFGRLQFESGELDTGHRGDWPLRIEELRSTDLVNCGGAANTPSPAFTTYLGDAVFPFALNWAATPGRQLRYDLREIEAGFGEPVFQPGALHVVHGFEFTVELATDQQIVNLDAFTASGRAAGFWLPSPVEAAQIYAGVSSTQFDVVDQQLAETLADHPAVHVWFTKDGQTPQAAKISSVADQGNGRERVTLAAATSVAVDETWVVQRLHRVRLAEDVERARFQAEGWQTRTLRVVEMPVDYATAGFNLSGLLAHWRLEEAGSSSRADSHGSYPLTPFNSPGSRVGKINNALDVDPAGARALYTGSPVFVFGNANFMFTGWVLFDSTVGTVLGRWAGVNARQYRLHVPAGSLQWSICQDGTNAISVTSPAVLAPGQWFFFACWHDATNDVIGIQVGDEAPVTLAHASGVFSGGSLSLVVGADNVPNYTDGGIDSLSCWTRILTAAEIATLYNGGAGLDLPFVAASPAPTKPQFLYQFTLQTPTPVVWYFCGAERDYTAHGATWLARPIEHGDVTRTLLADKNEITIEAVHAAGHPLALWLPQPPSARMELKIWEDVAGVRTALFTGYVRDVDFQGRRIRARASSWLVELDRRVPGVIFSPRCNKHTFDPNCGLVKSAWQVNATVDSITGGGVNLRVDVGGFSTSDADYFTFGEIQHGDGVTFESRTIMLATKVSGQPKWDLRLNLPFLTLAVSDTVKLWPGDDGSLNTCHARFNNKANFLGFPYMPADNPTLNPLTPKNASPKK